MKKRNITFPVYDKDGHLIKDGSIDGIPMKQVWDNCKKETLKQLRSYPWWKQLVIDSEKEQSEIDAYWNTLSDKQKKILENTKGTYIT